MKNFSEMFELYQHLAETTSTERLRSDIAYYDRKLELQGAECDAYIRRSDESEFDYGEFLNYSTERCRVFATIIRALSEELALRGEEA